MHRFGLTNTPGGVIAAGLPAPADPLRQATIAALGADALGQPLALDLDRWSARALVEAAHGTEEARRQAAAEAAVRFAAAHGATEWRKGYGVTAGGLAIVPVVGSLGPARYRAWTWYESIAAGVRAAVDDREVVGVQLVIDSPGGYVSGCAECGAAIASLAGGSKPVHAFANDLAASAAYWLGASAARVTMTADAEVGSVGVLVLHAELSQALREFGIAVTVIRSAARKAEANMLEPLTAAARAQLQHVVDLAAARFVGHVAARRGVSEDDVRGTEASVLAADQALAVRFADAVSTAEEARAALLAAAKGRTSAQVPNQSESGGGDPAAAAPAVAEQTPAADQQEQTMTTQPSAAGETAAPVAQDARAILAAALALPEAKGREGQVANLVVAGLDVAQVKATLAAIPAQPGFAAARADAAAAATGAGDPSGTAAAAAQPSQRILDSYAKARGFDPRKAQQR